MLYLRILKGWAGEDVQTCEEESTLERYGTGGSHRAAVPWNKKKNMPEFIISVVKYFERRHKPRLPYSTTTNAGL